MLTISSAFFRYVRLLSLLAGLSIGGIAIAQAQALDRVVAIVNNQPITQSQLQTRLKITRAQFQAAHRPVPSAPLLREQVLNQLIDRTLQLQVAKKANLTVSAAQVQQSVQQIAARNGITVAQLKASLAQQGMSWSGYQQDIHDEMLISQLQQQEVMSTITITPQEVDEAMRNLTGPTPPVSSAPVNPRAQYQVVDILIPVPDNPTANDFAQAQRQAEKLHTQLQQGVTLQTLSNHFANLQINNLGWRTLAQLPNLFVAPVSHLVRGQFSAPVRAANGYHILQLQAVQGVVPAAMNARNPFQQAKVNILMIKKTPLMTEAQLQARLAFLRQQILATHDFAAIAGKNSQDAATASKGGDMGWVSPGQLPPPVEQAIGQLAAGQLSQPIVTPNAWYLVQVTAKRHVVNPQAMRRDQAREIVYQRKYTQALQQWLQSLRGQSYVQILPE